MIVDVKKEEREEGKRRELVERAVEGREKKRKWLQSERNSKSGGRERDTRGKNKKNEKK